MFFFITVSLLQRLCVFNVSCCEFRYCTSAIDCLELEVERLVSRFRNRLLFWYRPILCVEWTAHCQCSFYSVSLHTSKLRGVAYSMISLLTYTHTEQNLLTKNETLPIYN